MPPDVRRRPPSAALLTDLYALTMMQAYVHEEMEAEAVFDVFVRNLPERRNYLLACGLEDALEFVQTLAFDAPALEYLESTRIFSQRFLDYLQRFTFTGDVSAVPEGTPVFPFEPLIEVTAPLPQ